MRSRGCMAMIAIRWEYSAELVSFQNQRLPDPGVGTEEHIAVIEVSDSNIYILFGDNKKYVLGNLHRHV